MSQFSILVVDDEPDNFDVIDAFLAEDRYHLNYASSGHDAIAALDTFNPDVILLDVMMPELDGLEVCQQIKVMPKWKGVPIIMVTALNSKEDMARCLAAGADDFISKPVNSVELRARVHSMLRIKQQYDSIKSLCQVQERTISLLDTTLNELRGNLTTSLPHEINTPLNGILGTIGLLVDTHADMNQAEIHEFLGLAYQSARRLEKLTQKFLLYLQLEVDGNRVQAIDYHDVSQVKYMAEHWCMSKANEWQRLTDLSLNIQPAELAVNSQYLQWVIDELIDNAFKFSKSHTPVKVTGEVADQQFILTVYDEGRGMTAEQITKIGAFMQFERDRYEQQGLGMGLKIVQKIVEMYGGELTITSHYGHHTTVQVTLPLASQQWDMGDEELVMGQ